MAGAAFRQKPTRRRRTRSIVHAWARQGNGPEESRFGRHVSRANEEAGTRGTPPLPKPRENHVGPGTLPAQCKARNDDETGAAAPESRKGHAVHTCVRAFNGFQMDAPVGPARTGDAPVRTAATPPAMRLPSCPAAWPRSHFDEILALAKAAFRAAATKRPRSRRGPHRHSTRFDPSRTEFSRVISRSGPTCAWRQGCHAPTRSAPALP